MQMQPLTEPGRRFVALGEEHAHLISTVRSVGYSFGQSRWGI